MKRILIIILLFIPISCKTHEVKPIVSRREQIMQKFRDAGIHIVCSPCPWDEQSASHAPTRIRFPHYKTDSL